MSVQTSSEEPVSSLKVISVVTFYIVAAIIMVTVNKWVLISSSIPTIFLFCQLVIAVLLLLLFHWLRFITLPAWRSDVARSLIPLIAVNSVGLLFNNLCLQYVDASFYQIARGMVLPITVGLSIWTQQNPPSFVASACCGLITAGFGIGVVMDKHSSLGHTGFTGVAFGLISSCSTALHSIVIKSSLPHVNGNTMHLAWYTNLLSTIAVIPMAVAMGEFSALFALMEQPAAFNRFLIGSFITGVVGFLICVAGFLSIKVTSPVTHMVSSAARGVIQTILSVWAFGDVISGARASSITVITAASMGYVWVKHKEMQAGGVKAEGVSSSSSSSLSPPDSIGRDKADQVPLISQHRKGQNGEDNV